MWVKIYTNLFENRKIKQILCLPDGDTLVLMWVRLLCLAGEINESGNLIFAQGIPYNAEMLATYFNKPLEITKYALGIFEKFGMIYCYENIISIANWEKYQNVDGMEKIREQTRLRVAKHREKQKLLGCNDTVTLQVTQSNATDKEKNKNKNKNKNNLLIENDSIENYLSQEEICELTATYPQYESILYFIDSRIKEIPAHPAQYFKKIASNWGKG